VLLRVKLVLQFERFIVRVMFTPFLLFEEEAVYEWRE
jgi:hypothetical protein